MRDMGYTKKRVLSVASRAVELGLDMPSGVAILPSNFDTVTPGEDLHFTYSALTVTKLLRSNGIDAARVGLDTKNVAYVHNRSAEWIVPVIFFGAEFIKQSPDLIGASLNVIQDYLKSFFGGSGSEKIEADVIVEYGKSGNCERISYKGDVEGLQAFAKVVAAASRKK